MTENLARVEVVQEGRVIARHALPRDLKTKTELRACLIKVQKRYRAAATRDRYLEKWPWFRVFNPRGEFKVMWGAPKIRVSGTHITRTEEVKDPANGDRMTEFGYIDHRRVRYMFETYLVETDYGPERVLTLWPKGREDERVTVSEAGTVGFCVDVALSILVEE